MVCITVVELMLLLALCITLCGIILDIQRVWEYICDIELAALRRPCCAQDIFGDVCRLFFYNNICKHIVFDFFHIPSGRI